MSILTLKQSAVFCCALGCFSATMQAQVNITDSMPARGLIPTGTFAASDTGTVNVQNGNLFLQIPLAALPPGRAGWSAGVNLVYNSQIWDLGYAGDGTQRLIPGQWGGWQYGFTYGINLDVRDITPYTAGYLPTVFCSNGNQPWKGVRLSVISPDQSHHTLYVYPNTPGMAGQTETFQAQGGPLVNGYSDVNGEGMYDVLPGSTVPVFGGCPQSVPFAAGDVTYSTNDGSYIKVVFHNTAPTPGGSLTAVPWTLYLPDGRTVTGIGLSANAMTDRNGNRVTVTNTFDDTNPSNPVLTGTVLADDLSRTITIQYGALGSGTDTITQTGADGTSPLTWSVQRTTISPAVSLQYACANNPVQPGTGNNGNICVFNSTPAGSGYNVVPLPSVPAVSSISLPTGQRFSFTYDTTAGWAELNGMTLPAGASVAYHYSGSGANKPNFADIVDNPIASKTLSWTDENAVIGRNETTTYCTIVAVPGNCAPAGRVTNPDGGTVSYLFTGVTGFTYNQLVGKVTQPDGSTEEKIWAQNPGYALSGLPNGANPGNPYVRYEIHSAANAAGIPTLAAVRSFTLDRNGNATSVGESDWMAYSNITHGTVFTIPGVPQGFASGAPASVRTATSGYRFPTSTTSSLSTDDANGYFHPSANAAWALPVSKAISGAGPGSSATFVYGDAYGHANLTSEQHWDSQTSTWLTTSYSYDSHGNALTVTNPRNFQTTFTYGGDGLCPATKLVAAAQTQQRLFTYDCTGNSWDLPGTETDSDQQITNTFTYDKFGRTTRVAQVGGTLTRSTATTYNDTLRSIAVSSDLNSNNDGLLTQTTYYDQLGRMRKTVDATGNTVESSYFTGGGYSYALTSNPYAAQGSASGWTLGTGDQNGRPKTTTHYSGAGRPVPFVSSGSGNTSSTGTANSSYGATVVSAFVTSQDEAGISSTSSVDGLGRMTQVVENGPGTTTLYAYDALDNLVQVTHPMDATQTAAQTRTFTYSSSGRLMSARNPETGTNATTYTYDANGNLASRILGGITTNYSYDPLDELTGKSYSDIGTVTPTPVVTYGYSKGRRTTATAGTGTSQIVSTYAYDGLGRILNSSQATNGATYGFPAYAWNLADELTSEEYPTGRVVTTAHDNQGRVSAVAGHVGAATPTTYANGFSYAPHGGLLGWTGGDQVVRAYGYNARLEVSGVTATLSSTQLLGLTLGYAAADNGNVMSEAITRPGASFTRNFTYDSVNRLKTASEGSNWNQTYVYDAVGNQALTASSSVIGSGLTPQTNSTTSVPFNGKNQWLGGTYDPGTGRLSATGTQAFQYDAEQRLIQQTDSGNLVTFGYDGDGRRVTKTSNNVTTVYVYDALGNLAVEFGEGTPAVTGTVYLTQDQLGSTRLTTNAVGSVVGCHDYLPFGQEVPQTWGRTGIGCYGQSGETNVRFTGIERDAETGLDHYPGRYGNAALGRFMTPDPAGNFVASAGVPQSWNLYTYVRNNPLALVDPTGLCSTDSSGGYSDSDGDDGSFLFQGSCSGGQIGGTAPQQVNVNARQGSWVDYFFVSTIGGINQPQIRQDPNPIYNQPITLYVRAGSTEPQVSKQKPPLSACLFAPHDFIQTAYGGSQTPSDPLMGNNNAVPQHYTDVVSKKSSSPKGTTQAVGNSGQFVAQFRTAVTTTVLNIISDCSLLTQ